MATVERGAETFAEELLPLHLRVAGRPVVVVGGGEVGARKVVGCLAAGAEITVVSPTLCPTLTALVATGAVRWRPREFTDRDLRPAWLVYAATGVPAVDARVSEIAERRRVFCVRADDGRAGTARSVALFRRDGLLVGLSTESGADPRRVLLIRDALADVVDSGAVDTRPQQHRLLQGG